MACFTVPLASAAVAAGASKLPGAKKSIVMLRSPVRHQFKKPVVKEVLDLTKKGE